MIAIAVAMRPFKYAGRLLDRGEIFSLKSSPRDEKLLALKFFALYDTKTHTVKHKCPVCSREFIGDRNYEEHRKKPDCFADTQQITQTDVSEMVGKEISKVE